jgi:hypothetical protein
LFVTFQAIGGDDDLITFVDKFDPVAAQTGQLFAVHQQMVQVTDAGTMTGSASLFVEVVENGVEEPEILAHRRRGIHGESGHGQQQEQGQKQVDKTGLARNHINLPQD